MVDRLTADYHPSESAKEADEVTDDAPGNLIQRKSQSLCQAKFFSPDHQRL